MGTTINIFIKLFNNKIKIFMCVFIPCEFSNTIL